MTNIKKAINYPSREGNVPDYYDNAYIKLVGGLADKYGLDPVMIAKLLDNNTNIPLKINKATADNETAQASTRVKNDFLASCKKDMLKVLNIIQDHDNFEEADMEDLGARVISEPADPNIAKPVITEITILSAMIIFDWIRSSWQGIFIESSYDGINWTYSDKDFKSPWEDKRKNQQSNVPEARYYRFKYMQNDQPIGLYTDVIKVLCEIY